MSGVIQPVIGQEPLVSFPIGDLPEYFPPDIEMRMQNRGIFDELHFLVEGSGFFYKAAHAAIMSAAATSFDRDSSLSEAVDIGVRAYEVTGNFVAGDKSFSNSRSEMLITHGSARNLIDNVRRHEDFLARLDFAQGYLRKDAPKLAAVVGDVAARHLANDTVATEFALKAAAVMRGMHIFVARKVAAQNLAVADIEA